MNYIDYEIYVKRYLEDELLKSFNRIIKVNHQEDLETATGLHYNIDLNYRYQISGIEYLTIVECKHWKTSITRDIVLTLAGKAKELNAHKAILVTTKGFQRGAIEYAMEKSIALIKMLKDERIEVVSHFNGHDLRNAISVLMEENEILESDELQRNISIVFPLKSVGDYLSERFGEDLVNALKRHNEKPFSRPHDIFNDKIANIIKNIPDDWTDDYKNIETSGLPMLIENTNEIRIFSMLIRMLQTEINIETQLP